MRRRLLPWLVGLGTAALVLGPGPASASTLSSPAGGTTPTAAVAPIDGTVGIVRDAAACAALGGATVVTHDDADGSTVTATIATAAVVASTSGEAACEVSGLIEDRIGWTVQLPLEDWNGRYFQTGCGGFCGSTPIASCAPALARGFAVGAEDTGHQDPTGGPGDFLDNPDLEADWGYRSPHLLRVIADEVMAGFYGQEPSHAYYIGCSTGGRQALSEAQRYPTDFDGIVAGAPALYQNYLAVLSQGGIESANRRADGTAILQAADVAVLSAGVLAACDLDDGRADGVVGDPHLCAFEPVAVQCTDGTGTGCLTAEQVAVAEALYSAPTAADGTALYPGGLALGSEAGWPGWSVGTDAGYSGGGNYAQNVLRYLAFPQDPGADYQLTDFDPSTQYRELDTQAQVYNAQDADLSAFRAAGGKLILWHGWADPLITPYGTIDYYERVVAEDGSEAATSEYARMFLLPGVYHCSGGPGEGTVDWLGDIVGWVEDGAAPTSVEASKVTADGTVTSTRTVAAFTSGSASDELVPWFATADETPTIASLQADLDAFQATGDIAGPVSSQLDGNLTAAQRYLDRDRPEAAARQLRRFVERLVSPPGRVSQVSDAARTSLVDGAEEVRASL